MNETKYRAWDKKRKRLYSVTSVHYNEFEGNWAWVTGYCVIEQKDIQLQIQPKDIVLMKYTGREDKNGVEIYSGDLFGKMGGDIEKPEEYEIHAIVYFDDDLAAFCIDDNRGGWEYLSDYLSIPRNEREIIGNKFENSDLLMEVGK